MRTDAALIQKHVAAYFAEDVECRAVNGAIGCLTPVAYPDGDHVAVWISERDNHYVLEEKGASASEAPKSGHRVQLTIPQSRHGECQGPVTVTPWRSLLVLSIL